MLYNRKFDGVFFSRRQSRSHLGTGPKPVVWAVALVVVTVTGLTMASWLTATEKASRDKSGTSLPQKHSQPSQTLGFPVDARAGVISTERGGFEPPIQSDTPYNGLANRRLQPLGHLSRAIDILPRSRLIVKQWVGRTRRGRD